MPHERVALIAQLRAHLTQQRYSSVVVHNEEGANPCASYLEPGEVKAILAQPDRGTPDGQRDRALLVFLYNTGARIQEALDVRPQAIRFDSPACVRIYGKGHKERLCPL